MSTERCPTCGRHVDEPRHAAMHVGTATNAELQTLSFDGTSYSTAQRASDPWPAAGVPSLDDEELDDGRPSGVFRRWPVLGLFLAAAVLLGGLQLLELVTGPPSPSNVLEEAGPEQVARPDANEGTAPSAADTTQLSAADREQAEVEEADRAFDRAAATGLGGFAPYVVTYRTNDGLVSLNETTAVRSDPKLLALYNEAEGFSFLPSDEGTWAVNPDDPSDSFLVSYSSEVVATRTTGRHVYVDTLENGRRIAGVIINGVTGPFHELPNGSNHLLVQDLGLLITPPTGGTVILASVSIEEFSDGRVVAATSEAWIVQRCDGALKCTLTLVDAETGTGVEIPDPGAGPPPALSPDGGLVLYRTDGEDFLYRVDAGRVAVLDAKIDPRAVWSPDGGLLAWIDGSDLVTVDTTSGAESRFALEVQPIAPSLLITMDRAS